MLLIWKCNLSHMTWSSIKLVSVVCVCDKYQQIHALTCNDIIRSECDWQVVQLGILVVLQHSQCEKKYLEAFSGHFHLVVLLFWKYYLLLFWKCNLSHVTWSSFDHDASNMCPSLSGKKNKIRSVVTLFSLSWADIIKKHEEELSGHFLWDMLVFQKHCML